MCKILKNKKQKIKNKKQKTKIKNKNRGNSFFIFKLGYFNCETVKKIEMLFAS
jgi:hypothetical protein